MNAFCTICRFDWKHLQKDSNAFNERYPLDYHLEQLKRFAQCNPLLQERRNSELCSMIAD